MMYPDAIEQMEPNATAAAPGAVGRSLARAELILLIVLIGFHLVPIWSVRYLPTQDGPAHVENARILHDLLFGSSHSAGRFYTINHRPVPNLLGHVLMAAIMTAVSPVAAEKLLISLFIVGLPLSVRYAARAIHRDGGWVAVLSLPFIYGLPLHKGLYNFLLSWPLMFMMIGFWLRRRQTMNWRGMLGLAALALLTYFSHLISLAMALMVIGVSGTSLAIAEMKAAARGDRRGILRRALLSAVGLLPAAMLLVWFFAARSGRSSIEPGPPVKLVPELLRLDALSSFKDKEIIPATGVAILLGGSLVYALFVKLRRRGFDRWDGLLVVVAVAVVIYLRTPNRAAGGGGQINFRLSLYPYLLLPLWLAAQRDIPALRRLINIAAPVLALIFVSLHAINYRELDLYMREWVSAASHMKPGSTLLSALATEFDMDSRAQVLALKCRPFVHAAGYIAAEHDAIDLSNYEGSLDYFPVQFRDEMDPIAYLDGSDDDLQDYTRGTAEKAHVDYVLLWRTQKWPDNARLRSLRPQLRERYQVEYVSPNGWVTLYSRR